jgi:hypothetical protein
MGKIEYAVVARGAVVLAEHYGASAAGGNAGAVARQVLERLPAGGAGGDDCNVSYTQDLHVFHVKRTDGLTALCMADDAAGRKCTRIHPAMHPLFKLPSIFHPIRSNRHKISIISTVDRCSILQTIYWPAI